MQTEENMRTDLWTLAVALYKTSLASHEEVEKWDRHAMAFDSHELEGNLFTIGVADSYSAEYYSSLYAEPLRSALVKAGAPEDIKVQFKVTESAEKAAQKKQSLEQQRKVLGDTQAILKKYIGTISANKKSTRTRLNRRQPERFDLSGSVDDKVLKIVVAIDTSGSMSDQMISQIFNEIFAILAKRKHDISVIECDATVW